MESAVIEQMMMMHRFSRQGVSLHRDVPVGRPTVDGESDLKSISSSLQDCLRVCRL